MEKITQTEAHNFRLQTHFPTKPVAAHTLAKNLCGVQAQVKSMAQMALFVRSKKNLPNNTEKLIIKTKKIIKTWAMRHTLHYIAADDLPMFIQGRNREKRMAAIENLCKVSSREFDHLTTKMLHILEDGPLTRKAIAERLIQNEHASLRSLVDRSWGGLLLHRATAMGVVCFGPEQGRETTFVRTDLWVPEQYARMQALASEDASGQLVRRYLAVNGPASPTDFAYWCGVSVKEARLMFGLIAGKLLETEMAGRPAFLLKRDLKRLREAGVEQSIRLLGGFDVYLLAHKSKESLVAREFYKRVYRTAGWISPVILKNGRVAGVWKHLLKKGRLEIRAELFEKLSRVEKRKAEEIGRGMGLFFGVDSVDFSWE